MRGILAKISPMNSHNHDPYLSRTMHIYISYFSVVVMKQYEQRQPKHARGFVFVFVLFMFLFFDIQLQRDDILVMKHTTKVQAWKQEQEAYCTNLKWGKTIKLSKPSSRDIFSSPRQLLLNLPWQHPGTEDLRLWGWVFALNYQTIDKLL